MASVSYVKCIMANVIMAKVLWQKQISLIPPRSPPTIYSLLVLCSMNNIQQSKTESQQGCLLRVNLD